MSTLVIAQTNNAGIQLSATPTDENTTDIVITFVSSIFDSLGSIDKSFPATVAVPGSFELTDADLTTLFGADNLALMKLGSLSPALSMSAQQFDTNGAEVEDAVTTIAGATALNQMYYLQFALPSAPVKVSVTPSNNKLTIVATVDSKNLVSDQIKLTVHKTVPGGLGTIANSTITGTAGSVDGNTRTYTFEVTPLVNGSRYEIYAKFANTAADGSLQYGPRNVAAFSGEPNDNAGLVSEVTVATALLNGEFDSTNAAIISAKWVKTETSDDDDQPTSYKMYVAKSDDTVFLEVDQDEALVNLPVGETYTLLPATIPRSWFTNSATSINVKVAIKEYFANSPSKLGNLVTNQTVYQMIMPTLGPVTMTSVSAAGLQTMSVEAGATGAGVYAISQTFNDVDTGNTTNTAVLSYDDINAAATNKVIVFTHSVVDANGIAGTVYSVTQSATLYAFKDPVGPATPTISVARVNADPVITFVKAANNNNNGYTIESYNVVVEYVAPVGNTVATYGNPYSANFLYPDMPASLTVTSNTGIEYIAGDFKVTVSSVLSIANIPTALYTQAALPNPISTSSTPARWWTRPTIDSIDVLLNNMTITGNNGGATYTAVNANAITGIGFTGDSDDHTLSKVSGAMPVASLGAATDRTAAELFAFTKLLVHGSPLIDLSGDYLDGLGFVDADNAPSALSIAVFNTAAIAEYAKQSEIGQKIADLVPLVTALTTARGEYDEEYESLNKSVTGYIAVAATALDNYNAAVKVTTDTNVDGKTLTQVAADALTAEGLADSAKGVADALVLEKLGVVDPETGIPTPNYSDSLTAAIADQATAQGEKDDWDAEVTRLEGSPDNITNRDALAAAKVEQTQADTDLATATQTTADAQLAYDNAVTGAATAAGNVTIKENARIAADGDVAEANGNVATAQNALTIADNAVTQSEARLAIDQGNVELAAANLTAALTEITDLGGPESQLTTTAQQIAFAEAQDLVIAAAADAASRTINPQHPQA